MIRERMSVETGETVTIARALQGDPATGHVCVADDRWCTPALTDAES